MDQTPFLQKTSSQFLPKQRWVYFTFSYFFSNDNANCNKLSELSFVIDNLQSLKSKNVEVHVKSRSVLEIRKKFIHKGRSTKGLKVWSKEIFFHGWICQKVLIYYREQSLVYRLFVSFSILFSECKILLSPNDCIVKRRYQNNH